jgi:hypothetical protein
MLNSILERFDDVSFLKADGFDEAIIGVDASQLRLIYSVKKCIKILTNDMTYDEAVDYFEYNVSGSYFGEKTPIWCHDDF